LILLSHLLYFFRYWDIFCCFFLVLSLWVIWYENFYMTGVFSCFVRWSLGLWRREVMW
jgi:hypothetical protein